MVEVKKKLSSSDASESTTATTPNYFSLSSIFWTNESYKAVAKQFHPFHKHDVNVMLHVFTTSLGIWGAIQLATVYDLDWLVYTYAVVVALTTPIFWTSIIHTGFVALCMSLPVTTMIEKLAEFDSSFIPNAAIDHPAKICVTAIILGYGLQDVAHWLCCEETMMNDYIKRGNPAMLIVHTIWLMPLVIDATLLRNCFLPFIVSRNRNVITKVNSIKAVDKLRNWINTNVPEKPETTHLWPHDHKGTDEHVTSLENDIGILDGFRTVFKTEHFDIKPVVEMNEIYVTAVGAIKEITSDAVFYTPHNDGPYWFLPFTSLYRVLVGVTPNSMVRTNFNLQHETQNKVLDLYDVLGFDYNRELHWIDHVPGETNKERRSLIKLHFIVYPKGWHTYGKFAASLNTKYNTWARNNFLRTLRPSSLYEHTMAWWIWLTTWFNAMFELYVGWSNLVYILTAYAMGPTPFLILTSFRHYAIYITTFAYRKPNVAHGFLMRDSKLFKTIALLHLSKRLLPLVVVPRDVPGVIMATCGFAITILATIQLGMVRTYFGSELGFVKPEWINGFPYNTIPHPMIVGQLLAYGSILFWWRDTMPIETTTLVGAHMSCYVIHMIQEILTSSY